MTAETVDPASRYRGRTTVRPQALRHLVEAVVAEEAGVPATLVRASLADDRGELAVSVTAPVDLTVPGEHARTLVERASSIAETVRTRVDAMSGRSVDRVDVRFSGVRRSRERRVK